MTAVGGYVKIEKEQIFLIRSGGDGNVVSYDN